jgi:hypothetical protein
MEREDVAKLYFYRSTSLQSNSYQNLRNEYDLKIREREVRTRLPCRILRLMVDLAWGTWQHLPFI